MKLCRDNGSHALVNTDEEGYKQARRRKLMRQKDMSMKKENCALKLKITTLENRLQAIEDMLKLLNDK